MLPWEIEKNQIHNASGAKTGEVKSQNAIELKFNLTKIQ